IKGTPIDWSKIEKTFTNKKLLEKDDSEEKPLTPEAQEVAKLVREVGRMMKIDYGLSSSSAWNQRLEDVLEQLHYQGVHDWEYQFSKISQMLLDRKMTTVVSGKNTVGTKKTPCLQSRRLARAGMDRHLLLHKRTHERSNQ
ncbi:MAG: C10 family peptidase, partial [Alistipes sp.]|nr:C10 family peptidase [Alistipes sp.]